jgi:hypothetical protein
MYRVGTCAKNPSAGGQTRRMVGKKGNKESKEGTKSVSEQKRNMHAASGREGEGKGEEEREKAL